MYLTPRFYLLLTLIILLLGGGYLLDWLLSAGQTVLALLVLVWLADVLLLYRIPGLSVTRHCADRFSNGDDNQVKLSIHSRYPFPVHLTVIDEVPVRFQERSLHFACSLAPGGASTMSYSLRPTERGEYSFGLIRLFARTSLGLVERRFSCGQPQTVRVYPSYLMLQHYELLAATNRLTEFGVKRIRRVGHQTEFEQIKDYVPGDDYRTINWKASARRHQLMTNTYQDTRSQPLYCLIDKGRVMQQAFHGMTLLDYAINASLVLSYVAIHKEDRAGLATFADRFDTFLPASRQGGQMQTILEALYSQQTTFGETDFSALCAHLSRHVHGRSLLVLYTNFDTVASMNRQLPYLKLLARQHRLLLVFFEDAELAQYTAAQPTDTESYYRHVIARKLIYEKRLITHSLRQHGIHSVLTTPQALTIDVINKYLELKARGLI